MQVSLGQLPFEVVHELRKRKWTCFFIFFVVSLTVLIVGLFWPEKYESSSTIFVDDQNIIRPLMEGSAVTTKVADRTNAAKEIVYNRRVLGKLVAMEDLWGDRAKSEDGQAALIAMLRNVVKVDAKGNNFFSISYTDTDPAKAFNVATKLTQLFIAESDASKREESTSAYEFVDKQVKAYQAQLKESETRLKDFQSKNVDGTEADSQARLNDLQTKIEASGIELKEAAAQKAAVEAQLSGESRMVRQDVLGQSYRARIQELQHQLDTLRLTYHDTYPDIVSLKQQINELTKAMNESLKSPSQSNGASEATLNPIYQEMRGQLALAETKISTLNTRIDSLNQLLADEQLRMARIQGNKAKLAELTRDMEVNKEIYDDLLKRREKARVSMRLDVEGQGLSYKIYEAAAYPLSPVGIRFMHFALAGLLVGLLAPIGLIAGILQVDPRIRVASVFEENTGIPVLTAIPHVETPIEHRQNRKRTMLIFICAGVTAIIYIWVCWLKIRGVLL